MDDLMQSIAGALPKKEEPQVQPAAPVAVAPVTPEVIPATPAAPVVQAEPVAQVEKTTVETPAPIVTEAPIQDPASVVTEWYDNPGAPVVTESVTQANPTPIDPIFEDEQVRLFVEARKAGKTLVDFVADFQVPDYSKYSDAEVVDAALKEMFPDQDTFDQAKATFESYDIFQQKQKVSEFRNNFNNRIQEKQKLLTEPLLKQQAETQEIRNRFSADLEKNILEITEKDYKGFTITADIANDVKKYVNEGFSLFKPDGTADVSKMIDFALWEKYGHQIVKANVNRAKNEGRKEVLAAVTNPSPIPSQVAPVNTGLGDIQAAMDNYTKRK